MIEIDDQRFCLNIPLYQAMAFSLGQWDLELDEPADHLRQLFGLLALDQLEFNEEWRSAAIFRRCLATKFPELRL